MTTQLGWIRFLAVSGTIGLCLQAPVGAGAATQKAAQPPDNSGNTIHLNGVSTVGSCVTVEAVLLAHGLAAMQFGGYVANNYAVVKTTISNHCDGQQFILHDIYFDYRNWALSGVYSLQNLRPPCRSGNTAASSGIKSGAPSEAESGSSKSNSVSAADSCDSYTGDSIPGQVATVGALDVKTQEHEDSYFTPRNKVVSALTLIGDVAQGYSFLFSPEAGQGVGAFNTAFVGSVKSLWPDRRIDQENAILAMGYRTDQSTVIAKEDHGSYYAFFPLKTFLVPRLAQLFLEDPAVFLNPAEAWFNGQDIGDTSQTPAKHSRRLKEDEDYLSNMMLQLAQAVPWVGHDGKKVDVPGLLFELGSSCYADTAEDAACPFWDHKNNLNADSNTDLVHVLAEKALFAHASLNSVSIVARGIMTIPVDAIPPTIDSVTFDNEKDPASLWTIQPAQAAAQTSAAPVDSGQQTGQASGGSTDAAAGASSCKGAAGNQKTLTGEITGKFLTGVTPSITISAPEGADQDLDCYVAKDSLKAVAARSSDSTLAFSLILIRTVPTGSKLSFQVSRSAPGSTSDNTNSSSVAGTSTQLTSNNFIYTVAYTQPEPTLTSVSFDQDTTKDLWQKEGTLTGTATGTNLSAGTVSKSGAEIGGKAIDTYIGTLVTKSVTDNTLTFLLPLLKPIPDGYKLSFIVSTQSGGTTLKSQPLVYTVGKQPSSPAKPSSKAAKPIPRTRVAR